MRLRVGGEVQPEVPYSADNLETMPSGRAGLAAVANGEDLRDGVRSIPTYSTRLRNSKVDWEVSILAL